MRRVSRRMQMVNIEAYSEYQDYLEVYPEEFSYLFNTLLINVTSFFRDRAVWNYVISEVIPQIVARQDSTQPIRVWSASCASGEEAYTIVMAIAEVIGVERFSERVKIYATDVDEEALNEARQATYSAKELHELSPEQLEQFFEPLEDGYIFRKELRRSVIFGRHDLIQDAPISRIDLLLCRNTLMYFNAETQSLILARFHFALKDGGFLFLGKAEMLLTHAQTFAPIDLKCRIFGKVSRLDSRRRLLGSALANSAEATNHSLNQARLREAAFDSSPLARIAIDDNGLLELANERARFLFGLTVRDLNRPLQDLEISYRPVELRSCIEQVQLDRRLLKLQDIQWQTPQGDILYLEVQVMPLFDLANRPLGACISFVDVTRYQHLQEELERSNQELEMAYEELQSSNEELETTNEELQSTNEELETINEELQSTNEELQTVNDELQCRSQELNQGNAFLESILSSLRSGVVVVEGDLHVQIWNHKAEDLWGLRTEEVLEQNLLNLDIGLPVEPLRQAIRNCLSEPTNLSSEMLLEALNRRGRKIQCHIISTPLLGSQQEVQGVILLMEDRFEESAKL